MNATIKRARNNLRALSSTIFCYVYYEPKASDACNTTKSQIELYDVPRGGGDTSKTSRCSGEAVATGHEAICASSFDAYSYVCPRLAASAIWLPLDCDKARFVE